MSLCGSEPVGVNPRCEVPIYPCHTYSLPPIPTPIVMSTMGHYKVRDREEEVETGDGEKNRIRKRLFKRIPKHS